MQAHIATTAQTYRASTTVPAGFRARLAVSARTYVEKFGGTFGSSVPALDASAAIDVVSGRTGTVIQLDQTSDPNGYLSNFGFTEIGGSSTTVLVTAKSGDTGAVLGTKSYSVTPKGGGTPITGSAMTGSRSASRARRISVKGR